MRSPYHRVRPLTLLAEILRSTHINEFDVPIRAHHDVFWLEVPIRDVEIVKIFDSQDDLPDIEL